MMALNPLPRKIVNALHYLASSVWIGAYAAVLALIVFEDGEGIGVRAHRFLGKRKRPSVLNGWARESGFGRYGYLALGSLMLFRGFVEDGMGQLGFEGGSDVHGFIGANEPDLIVVFTEGLIAAHFVGDDHAGVFL